MGHKDASPKKRCGLHFQSGQAALHVSLSASGWPSVTWPLRPRSLCSLRIWSRGHCGCQRGWAEVPSFPPPGHGEGRVQIPPATGWQTIWVTQRIAGNKRSVTLRASSALLPCPHRCGQRRGWATALGRRPEGKPGPPRGRRRPDGLVVTESQCQRNTALEPRYFWSTNRAVKPRHLHAIGRHLSCDNILFQ